MGIVKVFENNNFGDLIVITIKEKNYIEAIKVARILRYSNPNDAINRHCLDKGVVFHEVGIVTGRKANGEPIIQHHMKKFIDEGNLYRLIVKSKLPSAVEFESWIFDNVIPSIRKHGSYTDEQIIKNQQYAKLGRTVEKSDSLVSIGEFAKLLNSIGIDIGRNRMFEFLREQGYLMKEHGENQPKQIYLNKGLFKIRQFTINTSKGPKIKITTYITGKGQKHLINEIIKGDFCYGEYKCI